MSMLQVHSGALAGGIAAYHEFLLFYRNDLMRVYGFVEGLDDPAFYRNAIDTLLPDGWSVKLICAGNRKRVLEVLSSMDWNRFSERRVCFYVDRDLTDWLEVDLPIASNLYVTDEYSIENGLATTHTLERTLEEVLNIQGLSPDEAERIAERFDNNLRVFQEAMIPLMAQIVIWRRAGANPCLGNIDLRRWFDFQDAELVLKPNFEDAPTRLADAASRCGLEVAAPEHIDTVVRELTRDGNRRKCIRGKYLLWFVVKCALSFHASIGMFCRKYQSGPPRVRLAVGPDNAMAVLANRARVPASLRQFIERNYLTFATGLTS